jgi:hypothetical protein
MRLFDLEADEESPLEIMGPAQGRAVKAGVIQPGDFDGVNLKATVTFVNAFTDDTYAISISGADQRAFTFEDKTEAGFVINTNSDTELTGEVCWIATTQGETS